MKKSMAIATFAVITLGTLGTTTAVANASTASPSEGRSHTVERPAGTESKPAQKTSEGTYSKTLKVPAGTDAKPAQKATDDMATYSKTVKAPAGTETDSVPAQQR